MESTFSSGESTTGRIGVQHTGKRGPGTSSYTFVKPRVQCVPAATQQPARDRYGQKLPYSALPSLGNDPALMYSVHIVGQQRQMAVCLTQLARLEPDEGPQSPRQRRMACGCKRNDGDQRLKQCTLQSPHSPPPSTGGSSLVYAESFCLPPTSGGPSTDETMME